MRPTNVLRSEQGFTLPELMAVVVIVGVLAAFAAPGFLAWNQRKQVDAAMTTVEGAIKEAQRQAMAKSRECDVSFTRPSTPTPPRPRIFSNNGCLVTGTRTLNNVSMEVSTNDTSLTPASATAISFEFSHIGDRMTAAFTTPTPPLPPPPPITVVLTHSGNTNLKRCVVVSSPLGLIGTGEYTGTIGTISNRCRQP